MLNNNSSMESLLLSKALLNNHQSAAPSQYSPTITKQQLRKVRPEPINEKTLINSVVCFIQDVVGTDTKQLNQENHYSNLNHHIQSLNQANTSNQLKEEIQWIHFENFNLLDLNKLNLKHNFLNCNLLLLIGYKSGFSLWTIDLNGVATEALSIREPNIVHVKLLQLEQSQKLLMAICKLLIEDSRPSTNEPNEPSVGSVHAKQEKVHLIEIVNLLTGESFNEIKYTGEIIDLKSNLDLLVINSFNRVDAFDLNSNKFEHRFTINNCYSQISKSTGKLINPIALGPRWLAFADNKYNAILASSGGVSTDLEQSYTATVLNTAKSISKGLVKISESVVNSVVSKSKSSNQNSGSSTGSSSPRLGSNKKRNDSTKEECKAGICTVIDTHKFINTSSKQQNLHDENQNWIIAHFMAHQDPIYALEFNPTGRLLVTADSLGQYFNVFQINPNPFKCTRTSVKHLYSLYRGDTNAKVRHISFSSDSRWLAVGTKRGTTHVFPINSEGGPINARTHSKPFLVNRTSKHQRTAGFIDQEEILNLNTHQNQSSIENDSDGLYHLSPTIINNNPKLKHLLEPFVIPAYGQLKQPNANSTFQSSVISCNSSFNSVNNSANSNGLLACVGLQTQSGQQHQVLSNQTNYLTNSNLAASALQSAALVTENVTNFGIKNFSLIASNTSNMIQYDNVIAVSVFAETRGYLVPEEPRELIQNRLKPVNSLFVISDVNGNLVEYVLDVVVDSSKTPGNKPTNDSPVLLKITPKAQWPLQRFISSDEVKYPIQFDNPLFKNSLTRNGLYGRQYSNSSSNDLYSNISLNSLSPGTLVGSNSLSLYSTAPQSLNIAQSNNEWIKMIDINTHIGPHRRLFMGPQFQFKTFNSNLTTTMVNASSSSVIGDSETPIIDLSGDIELNSLDLSSNNFNRKFNQSKYHYHSTLPMQINSKTKKFDSTPTFIEIGAGSFQDGMPIMCGSNGSHGSQKSLNNNPIQCDLLGDNLIESLADAMSENTLNPILPSQVKNQVHSPAIAIANNNSNNNLLLMNANTVLPSSAGSSNSGSVLTVGSYFLINPSIPIGTNQGPTVNTSLNSCTSSSSASSSSSSSSVNSQNDNLRRLRTLNNQNFIENSIENNLFHDENLLQ